VERAVHRRSRMRVAFATQDLATVDAHFGWTPHLVVYEVEAAGAREVARHDFAQGLEDGDEDKLGPRLQALEGCTLVVALAMGGSAAARALAGGIRVVKTGEPKPIAALLEQLGRVSSAPPPWLRKALARAGEPPAAPGSGGGEP
jgi:nitrogen fixation protein NifX